MLGTLVTISTVEETFRTFLHWSKVIILLTGTKGLFLALIQHYFIQGNIKDIREVGFC